MNTGSLIITTEELGLSFSQYYNLAKPLGLSRETIDFLHKQTIICRSCGKYFSPKLNAPRSLTVRCSSCRIIYRREYQRDIMRRRLGLKIPRKPFKIFVSTIPTGSYIA